MYLTSKFWFQEFLKVYSQGRQDRIKIIQMKKQSDDYFRVDGIHLKREFGIHLLTEIFTTVRRYVDRGGVVSTSSSLEKDMQ